MPSTLARLTQLVGKDIFVLHAIHITRILPLAFSHDSLSQLTDTEIEQRLEELTFAIALDTTHLHAIVDHRRHMIQERLYANKHCLRQLRQERERRIISGTYNP